MKKISTWLFSLVFFSIIALIMPVCSFADVAGNFFENVVAVNGETIISAPNGDNYVSRSAEIHVQYDGENHGFAFSCRSHSIYSGKYVYQANVIESCTVTNEKGDAFPFQLEDVAERKTLYLIKPDAGTYIIEVQGRWTSGSITGLASMVVTFIVEKTEIANCITIKPYTGIYDGTYHNAFEVVANQALSDYYIEYKEPDSDEYVASMPFVKNVVSSGDYSYRICVDSENFVDNTLLGSAYVEIRKKSARITVQNANKCTGQSDPEFVYVSSGICDCDRLDDVQFTRDAGEEVGQYLIKASQPNSEDNNYTFTYTSGKLTIRDHRWKETTYTWSEDNRSVTAKRVCSYDATHIEEETVYATVEITKEPTCTTKGQTTYTSSEFTNTGFISQTKTLENIDEIGHEWGQATYNWNDDFSSVTAMRICTHDENHKQTASASSTSEVTKAATCTEKGETTYTSKSFNNSAFQIQTITVENILPLGHKWNEPVYVWNEDYTKVTATHSCINDESHSETETVSVIDVQEKELTCTQADSTIYSSGEFDNNAFIAQTKEIINQPAPGHKKIIDEPAVEPTCLYVGYTEQSHCEVCGEILSQKQKLNAKGHNKKINIAAKQPTCTSNGNKESSYCTVCGAIISSYSIIPAVGHKISIDKYVAPTTTQTGLTEGKHCSECGTILQAQRVIPVIPAFVDISSCVSISLPSRYSLDSSTSSITFYTNPNDTNVIIIEKPRSGLNYSTAQVRESLEELGATIIGTRPIAMTDYNGTLLKDPSTGATIYDKDVEVVYGNYTTQNNYIGTLAFCFNGVYYRIGVSAAPSDGDSLLFYCVNNTVLRHRGFKKETMIPATCQKAGKTERWFCSSCNRTILESQDIPELSHSLTKVNRLDATCTQQGYEAYWKCNSCGGLYRDAEGTKEISAPIEIKATGHTWCAPKYEWSADSTQVTATRICSNNSNHKEEQIAHTMVKVTKQSTCEEEGEVSYISASFTNPAFETQIKPIASIDAIGHRWAEPIYQWNEDNSEVIASRTCLNDSNHIEEEIVSTSVNYTVFPTCLEGGKGDFISASFANNAFQIQTKNNADVKPLGHNWGDVLYEWSDDYSYIIASRICIRDDTHTEEEKAVTVTQKIEPTCLDPGMNIYTAVFENLTFEPQRKEVITESAMGHAWGEVQYYWNDDYSQLTAIRICSNNTDHIEAETVSTHFRITKQPTCEEKGETTYTSAEFTNKAFSVQTIVIANIECIGHKWSEPVYEWKAGHTYVIASRVCNHNPEHMETETVKPTAVIHAPTENNPGTAFYQAAFENPAFSKKNKTVEIPTLKNLAVLELPSNTKAINEEVFSGTNCQVVIIPDTCQEIGYRAFANCPDLLYVRIPKSVIYVDDHAFDNSDSAVVDIEK